MPSGLLRRDKFIAVVLMTIAACGDEGNGPGGNTTLVSVGGTYTTTVQLENNTCPNVTVQPLPTTVVHTVGSPLLTVTHGLTYSGTVSTSGAFTTGVQTVQVGTESHAASVAGQFMVRGFDAIAEVNVTRQAAPLTCRYFVHWVGTKQGTVDNVLPGN
jgi:hypothetical protein